MIRSPENGDSNENVGLFLMAANMTASDQFRSAAFQAAACSFWRHVLSVLHFHHVPTCFGLEGRARALQC